MYRCNSGGESVKPTVLSGYMSKYLTEYLPGIQGASHNTISSKRDAYILLFSYLKEVKKMKPEQVDIPDLDKETIISYLDWLEKSRKSSISTRNNRLASIKSLFSYIQYQTPDYSFQCQQIKSIPRKKQPKHALEYLTLQGVKEILNAVDSTTKTGIRDLALLTVLYDSGARVQEIADLCVSDFRQEKPYTLKLTGKGQKTRIIPLMENTAKILQKYMRVYFNMKQPSKNTPMFSNKCGKKLTRAGITYILNKYVQIGRKTNSTIIPEIVSPHAFRHSKSMHMLQAGVPLIYIRDFLGHVSITTTEIYARCDTETKRKAIEEASPLLIKEETPLWEADDTLLAWLKSL